MPSVIQLGSTGEDVKRLQRILARSEQINLDHPITGVFDQYLDGVVRTIQGSLGVPVDGIVGAVTWAALPAYREASPTLSEGSSGPVVGWLQYVFSGGADGVIVDWVAYSAPIDGMFGPLTAASVRSFQESRNLTVDGVVGDETWFGFVTPGTHEHLFLEKACGLVDARLPALLPY
jgi:peptidoglycan hydrolase-like protein with peptidoglycan-binding domain